MRNLVKFMLLMGLTTNLALASSAQCPYVGEIGINLVKQFEGFSAHAYRDSDGSLAIGYGTHGKHITKKKTITEAEADVWLRIGLSTIQEDICDQLTVPVNGHQMAALESLAYNIGIGRLQRSGIIGYINAGNTKRAAKLFMKYNKANGKVLRGLTRRRRAEQALFLMPTEV